MIYKCKVGTWVGYMKQDWERALIPILYIQIHSCHYANCSNGGRNWLRNMHLSFMEEICHRIWSWLDSILTNMRLMVLFITLVRMAIMVREMSLVGTVNITQMHIYLFLMRSLMTLCIKASFSMEHMQDHLLMELEWWWWICSNRVCKIRIKKLLPMYVKDIWHLDKITVKKK